MIRDVEGNHSLLNYMGLLIDAPAHVHRLLRRFKCMKCLIVYTGPPSPPGAPGPPRLSELKSS